MKTLVAIIHIVLSLLTFTHKAGAWVLNENSNSNRIVDLIIANDSAKSKIILYHEAAIKYLHNDPIKSLMYLDSAEVELNMFESDSLRAVTYIIYGRIHSELLNIEMSVNYFYKALQYKSILSSIQHAEMLNGLAIVQKAAGNQDLALENFNKSYEIFDSLNDAKGLCYVNINFGMIYYDKGENEIALKYFINALEYAHMADDDRGISISCNNIGNVYGNLSQHDLTLEYYNKGLEYAQKNLDNNMIGLLTSNMGQLYIMKGEIEKGIQYIEKGKEISLKLGNKRMILSTSKHLGNFYPLIDEYEKAFENMSIHQQYYDSVFNEEMTQKIFQLNLKYEIEDANQEMEFAAIKKTKNLKIQRLLFFSWFIVSIIILLFIFFYFRIRMRVQKSKQDMIQTNLETEELKRKSIDEEIIHKNKELEKFALLIIKTNEFIQDIKTKIVRFKKKLTVPLNIEKLNDLYSFVNQSMSLTKSRKEFQMHLDSYYQTFCSKAEKKIEGLTDMEKHLIVLLRLDFSIKEIAAIFNISNESVAVYRSNLRKKIGLLKEENLCEYLTNI